MSRTKRTSRAAKDRDLFDEICRRVSELEPLESGMYVGLVTHGWENREFATPHRYQRHLIRADVLKSRASEIRVILEADHVVADFIGGKRLPVREAIELAREWRRKKGAEKRGIQATPNSRQGKTPQQRAQSQIIAAAQELIELLKTTVEPCNNKYTFSSGFYCAEFAPYRPDSSPEVTVTTS